MNKSYHPHKIVITFFLCSLVFPTLLYAQKTYERKISISEWIAEMENCKDDEYYLENTEIFFSFDTDSLHGFWLPRTQPTAKDKKSEKDILPKILLSNCKLPYNRTCQIRNIVFHGNITLANCEGAGQLIFYNCTFKQGVDFHICDLKNVEFVYSSLLQRTVVNESQFNSLSLGNCTLYTDYKLVDSPFGFGYEEENHSYQFLFNIRLLEKKINIFEINHCTLLPTKVKPVLSFQGGKYDAIILNNTNFSNSILNFINCSVKENFVVRNCKFSMPFGITRSNFPKDNTSFLWNQIDSAGLGLYHAYNEPPYTHNTDTLISDVNIYNNLNSSYRKFYAMYRAQGDMESANASYQQLKNMETGKYLYLYHENPTIHSWFNWRFNQFLKYYSDYGTNPVQSLIFAMWTILIFAAVYFFFYSDWDGINRSFLIKQHRKIMHYFRSEQRLEDFYTENYIDDFKTYAEYKKDMKESESELPFFIVMLGKPLYLLSVIRHKLFTFFYRKTEVLQGRWVDLKPARKISVALIVAFSILVYLISLAFVRALNSTTLSINAFSTLGFGAIPVKGISRYITIIEGFLGWFLLSIFSVSLISQMLQN